MPKKKSTKKPVQFFYNSLIVILSVIVIGFIYSITKKNLSDGVVLAKPNLSDRQKSQLAVDIYEANPVLDIKVEVLNGCGETGIAAKIADYLRSEHIDVIRWENADNFDYENTVLIHNSDDVNDLKTVANSLDFSIKDDSRINIQSNSSSDVDLTLLIGKDYRSIKPIRLYLANLPLGN